MSRPSSLFSSGLSVQAPDARSPQHLFVLLGCQGAVMIGVAIWIHGVSSCGCWMSGVGARSVVEHRRRGHASWAEGCRFQGTGGSMPGAAWREVSALGGMLATVRSDGSGAR